MERSAYDSSSWWSVLTFGWLTPTLERGAQDPIRNAPPLPERENSVLNGAAFIHTAENSDAMIRRLVWQYRWPLALMQFGLIIQHAIGLSSPLILKHILVFQEANNKAAGGGTIKSDVVTTGLMAINLYVLIELVRIFLNSQVAFLQARIHMRMKAALYGVVLDRSLHRAGSDERADKGGSGSDGGIYNVLESDTEIHISSLFVIMQAWLWPFTITTAAFLLYREIGAAAYPGVIAMCILQVIYLALNVATAMSRGPYLSAKDERIARLSETLQHVRSVRVNNWRQAMTRHVGKGRDKEVNWLSFREYLVCIDGALHYAHPTIIALVVFYYFIQTPGQSFKASLVLPVLGLLSQVNGPIGSLPNWIKTYIEYRNGSFRMQEYLVCTKRFPPADDAPVEELVAVNAEFRHGDVRQSSADEETLLPGFTLRANMRVRTGDVVALTGPPGCGKTMFLNAILGEVPKLRGVVHAPQAGTTAASREPVANVTAHALHTGTQPVSYPTAAVTFCAQVPWVFPGTAEQNILYGTRKDEDLYSRVVAACALEPDFELFADGDQTEVASTTISGGQRTRLALARAVYRALQGPARPTLVLLDDPLRSVDERVGRHIATNLLGSNGLLRRPNVGVVLACADVPAGIVCRKFQMSAGSIVDEQFLAGEGIVGGDNAQDGSGDAVPSALLTPKYSNPQDIDRRPPTPPAEQRKPEKGTVRSTMSPGEEQKKVVGKKQLLSTLSLYADEKPASEMWRGVCMCDIRLWSDTVP
jgi:ABC-type multidrug transport system fused ATPase/permease subunit